MTPPFYNDPSAAFNVLLYSETSQCDVIVGSASSSRKHPETEKMLGYFLNTIVLRARFSPKEHFLDLITRVREVVIGALSHDDLPFELLVSRFEKHRRPGVHPLFQVMFSLGPPLRHLPPGWGFTKTDVDTGAAKMDLWLDLDEREDGLIGRFLYSAELFDSLTISRLSKKWIILLDTISKEPNESVASLARFLRENNLRSSDVATHLGKRSKWYAPKWARSLWPGVDG